MYKRFHYTNGHEIETMVMFDDVDILVNGGKKLTWYFGHV
jgi:hypothetical protein